MGSSKTSPRPKQVQVHARMDEDLLNRVRAWGFCQQPPLKSIGESLAKAAELGIGEEVKA